MVAVSGFRASHSPVMGLLPALVAGAGLAPTGFMYVAGDFAMGVCAAITSRALSDCLATVCVTAREPSGDAEDQRTGPLDSMSARADFYSSCGALHSNVIHASELADAILDERIAQDASRAFATPDGLLSAVELIQAAVM